MEGLVSIVIPVFNSIKNLANCLDSVLAQTYKNIEVILVDDGSIDGSTELCREYEEKDTRVHVVVKENEGVSVARNLGIDMAKGEFLEFVDSDDLLLPHACETFVDYMKKTKVDIVICGYKKTSNHAITCPYPKLYTDVTELMPDFSKYFNHNENTINVPWNKMFRMSMVKARFPVDLSKGEDLLFNLEALEAAKGILFVEEILYCYNNTNEASLSARYREDGFEIEERLFKKVMQFHNKNTNGSKKFSKSTQYIFDTYLDGFKGKCIALTYLSKKSAIACVIILRRWVRKSSLRHLLQYKQGFRNKDKLMLYLIQYKLAIVIYLYYRYLYKKECKKVG